MPIDTGFSITTEDSSLRLVLATDYDPDQHGLAWVEAVTAAVHADCQRLHVDMNGYNRLDSRFFTALLQVRRHLDEHGVDEIVLGGLGPQIHVGMDLLRLRSYFQCDQAGHRGVQVLGGSTG